jgi:hypothetical protein
MLEIAKEHDNHNGIRYDYLLTDGTMLTPAQRDRFNKYMTSVTQKDNTKILTQYIPIKIPFKTENENSLIVGFNKIVDISTTKAMTDFSCLPVPLQPLVRDIIHEKINFEETERKHQWNNEPILIEKMETSTARKIFGTTGWCLKYKDCLIDVDTKRAIIRIIDGTNQIINIFLRR